MNSGATPTTALARSKANGVPRLAEAGPTSAAAAPSTTAQLFPAVCTPPSCTARSRARAAKSPCRGWLSSLTESTPRARRILRD
ncbi:hypothetical protein D3C71_1855010 [compost metagenome]